MKTCSYCGKESQDGATRCDGCGTAEWLPLSAPLPSAESTEETPAHNLRGLSAVFLGLSTCTLLLPAFHRLEAALPWFLTFPLLLLVVFTYACVTKRIRPAVCYTLGAVLWAVAIWQAWSPRL